MQFKRRKICQQKNYCFIISVTLLNGCTNNSNITNTPSPLPSLSPTINPTPTSPAILSGDDVIEGYNQWLNKFNIKNEDVLTLIS